MKIYEFDYRDIHMDETAISACIGYFDGLHVGHQQLLQTAKEVAREKGIPSALITFDPDPWVLFKKMEQVPHITTLTQRQKLAEEYGIDVWITLRFTWEFSSLLPDEFVKQVLVPLHVVDLTCGFDYSYGKFGQGKATDLQQYDMFTTHVVDQVSIREEKISSTRIDGCIEKGEMEEVQELLGRPYTMVAPVIHGRHIGHSLGYPTANIDINGIYMIPAKGVYAAKVTVDGNTYDGMVNVGHNPTLNMREDISVETYIFDFDQDIYDKEITIEFYHKTRDEFKFSSKEELVNQLQQDVQTIKDYFSNRA